MSSYVVIDHHSVYRALERERGVNDKLRENLDSERRSLLESTDRENSIFEDMQLELDSERAKVNDLKNSMEREKQRLQSQVTALETQTSALKDELEQERLTCRQLKNEIDQIQVSEDIFHMLSMLSSLVMFKHFYLPPKTHRLLDLTKHTKNILEYILFCLQGEIESLE